MRSLSVLQAEQRAARALAAGAPKLMRGLVHVIDHRTSDVCLDLARQGDAAIVEVDEPWDTLLGPQMAPPFHDSCRSLAVPVVPGEIEPQGATTREADAERRARKADDQARETRRPSRPERRRRKRDVQRAVRREQRARREANRRRRQGATRNPLESRTTAASRRNAPTSNQRPPTSSLAPAPVPPRYSSLREWTAMAAEINRVHDPLSDDDPAMRVLLRRQRWTGPPSTVPRGTLRNLALAYLLYRGLAAAAEPAQVYAEQLRTGTLVLGLGAGGVGLYFALPEEQAQPYAGPDGVVQPAGVSPGARVVTVEELVTLRDAALASLTEREARSLRVVTADPGRLAAALGVDAVTYPDGTVLVVNRTALVMEEP